VIRGRGGTDGRADERTEEIVFQNVPNFMPVTFFPLILTMKPFTRYNIYLTLKLVKQKPKCFPVVTHTTLYFRGGMEGRSGKGGDGKGPLICLLTPNCEDNHVYYLQHV